MYQKNPVLFGAVKRSLFNFIRQQRFVGFSLATLAFLVCALAPAGAETLQVLEDTYSANGVITKAAGTAATLLVGAKNSAYIKFGVTNAGLTAGEVTSARLTLYFPAVTTAGTINLFANTSDFSEILTKSTNAPTQDTTNLASVALTTADKQNFVVIDVTEQVQAWLAGTVPDYGFAITTSNGAKLTIGAKEGPATGYPAVLEVDVSPSSIVGTNATLTGNVTAASFTGNGGGLTSLNASQLASGTVPLAQLPANVALLDSNQIFTGQNVFLTNIGIGTTNPLTPLHVFATMSNAGVAKFDNLNPGGFAGIYFDVSNSLRGWSGYVNTNSIFGGRGTMQMGGVGDLIFSADPIGVYSERMRISATSGFVGIGTTNPSTALQVKGTVTATSFAGNGGGLTNLNVAQLSGPISVAQLPNEALTNNETTSVTLSNLTLTGNLNLPANNNNTAIGNQALAANTSGYANTAIGDAALFDNTNGFQNTAVGATALAVNTSGFDNTAVGDYTLGANTTGYHNLAIGFDALANSTNGYGNTAVGDETIVFSPNSLENTAVGSQAMAFNYGSLNTVIGYSALPNTTGNLNIAVGYEAGFYLNAGTESNNIYIGNTGVSGESGITRIGTPGAQTNVYIAGVINGDGSGLYNLTVAQLPAAVVTTTESTVTLSNLTLTGNLNLPLNNANTAIGYQPLQNDTSGSQNTATGFQSLLINTTGSANTATGYGVLANNTNGNNNTGTGFDALVNNTSGNNNTALGYNAGSAFTTSESFNIDIANNGVLGESGVTRIGTPGVQTNAYIAGIINGNGGGLTNVQTETITGNQTVTLATSTFYFPWFGASDSTTESAVEYNINQGGILTNFMVTCNGLAAGTNVVWTVLTNGVPTSITCTVNGTGGGATFAVDTTDSISATNYTIVSLRAATANANVASQTWAWRFNVVH